MCDETEPILGMNELEEIIPGPDQPHSTCTGELMVDNPPCGGNIQSLLIPNNSIVNCATEGNTSAENAISARDEGDDDGGVSDGSLGTGTCLYSDTSLSELTPFDPLLPLDSALQCFDQDQELHDKQQNFPDEKEHEILLIGQEAFEESISPAVPIATATDDVNFDTHSIPPVNQVDVITSSTLNKTSHQKGRDKKKKCKNVYKHVPHREKPPHLVARRNARERRRVQSVNVAFTRLRRVVPCTSGRSKRVSKVKTLQGAIDYIQHLQDLLKDSCSSAVSTTTNGIQVNNVSLNCAHLQENDKEAFSSCAPFCDEISTSYGLKLQTFDRNDSQHYEGSSNDEDFDESEYIL